MLPVTVTAALADFVVSALETIVTVWVPDKFGAKYMPAVEMLPTTSLPPGVPSTYHLTPIFVVPVTVATNCLVWVPITVALVGEMVIVTGAGLVTVTVALALCVGAAFAVIETVCVPTVEGAV
jgi:hypothetical protein